MLISAAFLSACRAAGHHLHLDCPPQGACLQDRIAGASLWSPRPPKVVWHRWTQHVPPLRMGGGEKCHRVLVSFRKQLSYLKSAYKVLEEGPKNPAT